MKKLMIVLLMALTLLSAGNLRAEYILPEEGDLDSIYEVDLNGDGIKEKVAIKAYRVDNDSFTWFGQLVVFDYSWKTIWAGPKTNESWSSDPLIFGSWEYGASLPEAVGDLDGDGNVEIIATCPVSDVRFTPFKLLRWNGKEFYSLYDNATLVQTPKDSGRYPWGNEDGYMGRYISGFSGMNDDGTFNVFICDFTEGDMKRGQAVVAPDSNGFHICRWLEAPNSSW